MPGSEAVGLTPMLAKPVSELIPSLLFVSPSCWTAWTEAVVISGPEWHLSHRPLPPNTLSPDFAWSLMAALSPARNRSSGVWSETSVASQVWIASPQKSEKLNSIIVYERPVAGSVRVALEFHH